MPNPNARQNIEKGIHDVKLASWSVRRLSDNRCHVRMDLQYQTENATPLRLDVSLSIEQLNELQLSVAAKMQEALRELARVENLKEDLYQKYKKTLTSDEERSEAINKYGPRRP